MNKTSTTILVGGSEKLYATVSPSDASDKSVFWSSSGSAVATVDSAGVVKGVSAGSATVKATTDGTFFAWGSNSYSQLGDGGTSPLTVPMQVWADAGWAAVSAGVYFSLAVRTDGTLYAWRRNDTYQLEDGTTTTVTTPAQIGAAANWKSVEAGGSHGLGLKTDDSLWAWGYNGYGRLGDGTETQRTSPVQVP